MSKSLINLLVILTMMVSLPSFAAEYFPTAKRDGFLVTPACDVPNYRDVCVATIGDGKMTVGANLGARTLETFLEMNGFEKEGVTEETKYPEGIVWLGTGRVLITAR